MSSMTAAEYRRAAWMELYADKAHDERDPDTVVPVVVIYASDPEPIRNTLRRKAQEMGWRIQEVNE